MGRALRRIASGSFTALPWGRAAQATGANSSAPRQAARSFSPYPEPVCNDLLAIETPVTERTLA